jgi:fluoride exporter
MTIRILCIIGLGGFIGSIARYSTTWWLARYSAAFPYGTLAVNTLGCLVIGFVYGLSERFDWMTAEWRLFLVTGICGAYTTFSAFAIENLVFLQEGLYLRFALYSLGSFIAGLMTAFVGILLARI